MTIPIQTNFYFNLSIPVHINLSSDHLKQTANSKYTRALYLCSRVYRTSNAHVTLTNILTNTPLGIKLIEKDSFPIVPFPFLFSRPIRFPNDFDYFDLVSKWGQ